MAKADEFCYHLLLIGWGRKTSHRLGCVDANTNTMLAGEQASIQLDTGEPLSKPFIVEIRSYKAKDKDPLELCSAFKR